MRDYRSPSHHASRITHHASRKDRSLTIAPLTSVTSHRPPILARHSAIASGHYLATEAGMRMFRRGGNAIDAGVAAGICIDVLLPDLCNFGGVAPTIVYHKQSGDLVSISGLGPWGRS